MFAVKGAKLYSRETKTVKQMTLANSLTVGCLFSLNKQQFSLIFIFFTSVKETVIVAESTKNPKNFSVCVRAQTDFLTVDHKLQ